MTERKIFYVEVEGYWRVPLQEIAGWFLSQDRKTKFWHWDRRWCFEEPVEEEYSSYRKTTEP